MGYNRGGARRKARLGRARREAHRLALKAEQPQPATSGGILGAVNHAATAVAHAMGTATETVVDAVRGKHGE